MKRITPIGRITINAMISVTLTKHEARHQQVVTVAKLL